MNLHGKFGFERITKVIYYIILCFSILFAIQAPFTHGMEKGLGISAFLLIAVALSTILYLIHRKKLLPELIVGTLMPLLPGRLFLQPRQEFPVQHILAR